MFTNGELVVCVHDTPIPGTKWAATPNEKALICKGKIYRISRTGVFNGGPCKGQQAVDLVGVPNVDPRPAFSAIRFRKLQKSEDEFKELIKNFDPAKKRKKANV